jgi:plastocyanin
MSRRRILASLATAALAALATGGVAHGATVTVLAGGPPPKALTPSSLSFSKDLDLNGFYRRTATIHVGDTVRWQFSRRVVHTVTFLPPGQSRIPLEGPDPAHPYTGYSDATGAGFWFNGQPGVSIPPANAFPQGGASTDGTGLHGSGLSAPAFAPYSLTFTKTGTFRYLCLVHPGMNGRVKVVSKSSSVPTARQNRAAREREMRAAVRRARALNAFKPSGNRVVGGHDAGAVAWFRWFPKTKTVKAGTTVTFSISSKSEIHTATFGPRPQEFVLATPQPAGPPLLQFNPLILLPSDPPPALPPYTGQNHGNGFFNTGAMDTNPASPLAPSTRVTFTVPGTYVFECMIHPGMEGTIKVT